MWMLVLLVGFGPISSWSRHTSMNTYSSYGVTFEGQVRILCLENSIGIEVSNAGEKNGRLYAKKMSESPNCVKHYSSSDRTIRLEIPFNNLLCGIKSKQMTQPRSGTEYSVTVILSYGQQLTEDDQMFSLSCRYFANRREIGTVIEVSTFTTSYLVGGKNGPACEYSLRYGSLNGPAAENARIGDKVYHKWKCMDSSFALKVYDCYVHDGNNRKYKLLDEQGCSKDKTILPELTYDPELNHAFAASRVFKFAEATKMFFNCLLYMCPKSDPACRRSVPPKCNSGRRRRSFVQPTVGPARLFTVNASLPFEPNSASTVSFERSPETSAELDYLSMKNELIAEQTLNAMQLMSTTQASTTTQTFIEPKTFKMSKIEDIPPDNEEKTAILPAPVIELQPISTTLSSCSTQARDSVKVILVGLVGCNVVLLTVSTIAIAALCRRHNSAQLDLTSRSYYAN